MLADNTLYPGIGKGLFGKIKGSACKELHCILSVGGDIYKGYGLVIQLLPDITATYNSIGAPILVGEKKQIAVSHTPGYAALFLSDQPCGIDIELPTRDFSCAASKFLSDSERKLIEAHDSHLHQKIAGTIWCAKECLYKWAKIPGLNFVDDITVERIDSDRGLISGSLLGHPVSPSIFTDE